ncbi:unnamed protein product [Phytophthora fragariaefolia]|uniref:Unnamed protein product n=1 Tax=Phytophthora fragariaefolia TaxID=1490495 RepID=A0A9W6XL34_9STRA|nr:unnamed protein product [Phytophthora fragariaefolia]
MVEGNIFKVGQRWLVTGGNTTSLADIHVAEFLQQQQQSNTMTVMHAIMNASDDETDTPSRPQFQITQDLRSSVPWSSIFRSSIIRCSSSNNRHRKIFKPTKCGFTPSRVVSGRSDADTSYVGAMLATKPPTARS